MADSTTVLRSVSGSSDSDAEKQPVYLDLDGEILPSGRTATVLPLAGKAEERLHSILTSENVLTIERGWTDILRLCTSLLDGHKPERDEILDLTGMDRLTLMLRMRHKANPDADRFYVKWRCGPPFLPKGTGCKRENVGDPIFVEGREEPPPGHLVSMGLVEMLPVPDIQPVKLPVAGKTATYEAETGRTALAAVQLRPPGGKNAPNDLFLSRNVKLDGLLATANHLNVLTISDRSVLRREMTRPGGPDSSVTFICENDSCGTRWKTRLELLPGFFFLPTEE